jgi:hypothetical protein
VPLSAADSAISDPHQDAHKLHQFITYFFPLALAIAFGGEELSVDKNAFIQKLGSAQYS